MTKLTSLSRIDPRAELGFHVEIGPFCTIGPDVRIGQGTRLISHVCIMGDVTLGEFNTIGPFVTLGDAPQDLSYKGTPTRVEIGDYNVLRQCVTVHRGSEKEDGTTRIGSRNVLMAGAHVAHDCQLGDRITIAERTVLGGHVHVESDVEIANGVAVVHEVTVGGFSFVGSQSKVTQDVPRYMRIDGYPSRVRSLNTLGLRRNDFFCEETIQTLREAHRLLYRAKKGLQQTVEILRARGQLSAEVLHLIAFVEAQQAGKNGRARDRGANFRKARVAVPCEATPDPH
ncbi:acyl-ACP--UDP-N-acetylglucosamine O-acyltransferase [Singulisphaera sp. GP187]|uniref:acyl-ACP--UDP-N-acetylglucosamine O-acyltransferase n=1 Tax=Singulisphaera sp. GP187 TaxID=1882752 RepID=UPI0020B11AE8|nr:acyl-ACP--UDP-N-acetylglucosamine O-acyltransferase [Singulisphaera sp. GP187]